jgi:hypothetical protein
VMCRAEAEGSESPNGVRFRSFTVGRSGRARSHSLERHPEGRSYGRPIAKAEARALFPIPGGSIWLEALAAISSLPPIPPCPRKGAGALERGGRLYACGPVPPIPKAPVCALFSVGAVRSFQGVPAGSGANLGANIQQCGHISRDRRKQPRYGGPEKDHNPSNHSDRA